MSADRNNRFRVGGPAHNECGVWAADQGTRRDQIGPWILEISAIRASSLIAPVLTGLTPQHHQWRSTR